MSEDTMMYPGKMLGQLAIALEKLGWEYGDEVDVEIGGTSVSGIDVGEEYNKKWQSPNDWIRAYTMVTIARMCTTTKNCTRYE